ncbi:MAG: hypothetical protein GY774_35680 [Planctomycetes bacterium]|nr:hypothetical protein [Planctomycetota bacterium]
METIPIKNEAFELLKDGLIKMIDKRLGELQERRNEQFYQISTIWMCEECGQQSVFDLDDPEPLKCPYVHR